MIERIEHADDPRLREYRGIRDRVARRRAGLFVGEGLLVVRRMLARPGVTVSALVAEALLSRLAPLSDADVPILVAPLEVLRTTAGFDIHRGALALGRRGPFETAQADALVGSGQGPFCGLACEGITNADNVGALFRNAAAFGVDAVLLDAASHDPLYRRSLRVSIGHVLDVPFARLADWPRALRRLADRKGLKLVAAATGPGAVPVDECTPLGRGVLVVGTEGVGLSAETLAMCDAVVRVPMAPGVDSLNVAVAAGVCLHRLCRGRRT